MVNFLPDSWGFLGEGADIAATSLRHWCWVGVALRCRLSKQEPRVLVGCYLNYCIFKWFKIMDWAWQYRILRNIRYFCQMPKMPRLLSRSAHCPHDDLEQNKKNKLGLNWAELSSNLNWTLLLLRLAKLHLWLPTTITNHWALLPITCRLACLLACFFCQAQFKFSTSSVQFELRPET